MTRARGTALALLCVTLGTAAFVYDTMFSGFVAAIALTPWLLWRCQPPLRRRLVLGLGLCAALAFGLACVEGVAFTAMARNRVGGHRPAASTHQAGLSQEIVLHFPKSHPGTITIPGRGAVALWSHAFLQDQGLVLRLCLLSWAWALYQARPLHLMASLFGLVTLAIPALFDFGVFNAEAPRFVAHSATGSALAFGLVLADLHGLALRRLETLTRHTGEQTTLVSRSQLGKALSTLTVAGIFIHCCSTSSAMLRAHRHAAVETPQVFAYDPDAVLLRQSTLTDLHREDLAVLEALRSSSRPEERMLSNLAHAETAINGVATLVAASGCHPAGVGSLPPDPGFQGVTLEPLSARAQVFWATADPERAHELGARWLYVCTRPLAAQALQRLESCRSYRLRRGLALGEAHQHRLYEVIEHSRVTSMPSPCPAADLEVVSFTVPHEVGRDTVAWGSATLRARRTVSLGGWRLASQHVDAQGHPTRPGDESWQGLPATLNQGERLEVPVPLAGFYRVGVVRLGLALCAGERCEPLGSGPQAARCASLGQATARCTVVDSSPALAQAGSPSSASTTQHLSRPSRTTSGQPSASSPALASPVLSCRLELPGGTPPAGRPRLVAGQPVVVHATITNHSSRTLPGGPTSSPDQASTTFGCSFEHEPVVQDGTFICSLPLPAPLPPGATTTIDLDITGFPLRGDVALVGMLWASSPGAGGTSGRRVGNRVAMPVHVEAGPFWVEQRDGFVRGLARSYRHLVNLWLGCLLLLLVGSWKRGKAPQA